jgi:hypothetical protein
MSHVTNHATASSLSGGKAIVMSRHEVSPVAANAGTPSGRQLPTEEELREISASLRGLRYGSVSIVVQDGVIIQIDRVEKRRLRNRDNGRT